MPVTRRTALKILTVGAAGAATGAAAYGFAFERHRFGVTRVSLRFPG